MSLSRIPSCLFLFFLFFSPGVNGQLNADDSSYFLESIRNVQEIYFKNIGTQAAWMNGRMNVPYSFQFEKGNPYFNSAGFINSTLVYDGISYEGIPLLYDELKTTLVALSRQGRIELPSTRVDGFTIGGNKFVRIKDAGKSISASYYQVLYSGNLKVLKKTKKEIREDLVSGTGIVRSIEEKRVYFLQKENVYYSISGKQDLLKALKDHTREIQQYIKKQKLKWKNDADRLIAGVAAYYDQLTK